MNLTEIETLTRDLLALHGVPDVPFEWDRARSRAGCVHWTQVPGRDGYVVEKLTLSKVLLPLWDEADVRDTILHEIAHVLAGPTPAHGARWKATAAAIGATATACYSRDLPAPPAPWIGTCPAGHTSDRHRKPKRPVSCGRCLPGRWSEDHLITWTRRAETPAEAPAPKLIAASRPRRVPDSHQEPLF